MDKKHEFWQKDLFNPILPLTYVTLGKSFNLYKLCFLSYKMGIISMNCLIKYEKACEKLNMVPDPCQANAKEIIVGIITCINS